MHFLVGPLRPPARGLGDGTGAVEVDDKLAKKCAKLYYMERDDAIRNAKQLAVENPGVQFALFIPSQIFETIPTPPPPPPPPPKMVAKRITEQGEIVVDKEQE